eukprot:TRINITY_DN2190_c0_g1_i1.p1 TRINITY_DN2190_c0_g1~~TRINITY_DN2190_c0_g1_i1.p1  ORF type:complete len:229 (-),score=39.45 TRINITY_DN2190_c0_g1_i1:43-729(-)
MKAALVLLFVFFAGSLCQSYPPVSVELYFESLCPYCRELITGGLWTAWEAHGIKEILNLTFVPYGNAHRTCSGGSGGCTFVCQHGPNECAGNILDTCAIKLLKSPHKWVPFIKCVEDAGDPSAGSKCASLLKVDWNSLNKCITTAQGNDFEREMGEKTDSLSPSHNYVPWVVLNGVHTEDINRQAEDDFLGLVCKTYTGPKPQGCETERPRRVSYKNWKAPVSNIIAN